MFTMLNRGMQGTKKYSIKKILRINLMKDVQDLFYTQLC